ncbi:hypothetical protein Scep_024255 [Stephania cephalantha]|uniref:Uncharacterized protein n=1 Tax=Stephania cephalantha TaxID=152367 RepID=A0AAP0EW80_9MAGN
MTRVECFKDNPTNSGYHKYRSSGNHRVDAQRPRDGEFENKEKQVINFDEAPKFDVGDEDFIIDIVVFGDDGHVIEIIAQSTSPRVLQTMVDDGVVDNYPVEKGVETKENLAATKHFCSLTDDMDEKLVVDALQDSRGSVFLDNIDLMVEFCNKIPLKHVTTSGNDYIHQIAFKQEFSMFEDFVVLHCKNH